MAASARAWSWWDMLGGVVYESRRVVSAHSRHFLGLSVLFLLPLSSLLVASPSLPFLLPSSSYPHSLRPFPPPRSLRSYLTIPAHSLHPRLALVLLYAFAALALTLCAVATIARSAHSGFFGRPVKLVPAVRSLLHFLPRLILTFLAAASLIFILLSLVVSLVLLSLRALSLLHSTSPLATHLAYSTAAALTSLTLLYLSINWALAAVVSVIESSWGFEPLRRSVYLVQGMRWAVLCLNLFFVAGIGIVLWEFSLGTDGGAGAEVIPMVARTVFGSAATAVLLLYWLVTSTVLYMYCKALHGELAGEIAEEFAWEYVCLPFDDQKVPHVVSVVRQ